MHALQLSRGILSKEMIIDRTCAKVFALLSFVALTALGAHVWIPLPFTPVPITLQTFFVLLSGAVLGRRWGAASQIGYLCLGWLGLPVFAGVQSGIGHLWGPTGGYIIGFVVTSWLTGKIIHQKAQNSTIQITLAMIISSLAGIYLFGLFGLSLFLRCDLPRALALGFSPFIVGDTIKIISASLIYRKIDKRCRSIFYPYD